MTGRSGDGGNFDWAHLESLQALKLKRIGGDAKWKELYDTWPGYARKADGSVWLIETRKGEELLLQQTNLEQVVFHTVSFKNNGVAYVRLDGTLWVGGYYDDGSPDKHRILGLRYLQAGKETNWVAVTVSYNMIVALKSDGSLWQWNVQIQAQLVNSIHVQPTRLGIHDDWVAISDSLGSVIALAADGSLWLWPDRKYYGYGGLLKLPKQPQFLGNVFGKAD